MSLIRLRADAVPVAGCARVVRLSRDADGVLVFVEGDAGGCERNGAKLISELLWEDCRAALRLQANPGTGSRIRQQAGSHRNLSSYSGFVVSVVGAVGWSAATSRDSFAIGFACGVSKTMARAGMQCMNVTSRRVSVGCMRACASTGARLGPGPHYERDRSPWGAPMEG